MFACEDGKDQESSSEDGFASYAIKMWGKVIGDANMEKRGSTPTYFLLHNLDTKTDICTANLMLAVQARSFNTYIYLLHSSDIHPGRYTPNGLAGILFENKIDYTTWFTDDPAIIHAVHMNPLNPSSILTRPHHFVQEEWDAVYSHGRAIEDVQDRWKGVVYANLALIDPKQSFNFFRDGIDGYWDERWIDGGASRTWYLVWAAGLSELEPRKGSVASNKVRSGRNSRQGSKGSKMREESGRFGSR